jgi:hypothetical protein
MGWLWVGKHLLTEPGPMRGLREPVLKPTENSEHGAAWRPHLGGWESFGGHLLPYRLRGILMVCSPGWTSMALGAREPGKQCGVEGCGHPVVLP